MRESKYWLLMLFMWLLGIFNTVFIVSHVVYYEKLPFAEVVFWGMWPLLPVIGFAYGLNRYLCKEKLDAQFANHESKRHFQVIQSLLYLEKYEEVKEYIRQIDIN